MNVMRVAVTGRHGQVVQSLLERAGPDIHVLTIARPEADMTNPQELEKAIVSSRPHIVVNAAAYTAVDLAEREIDLAREINVTGAKAVADAAATLGIPIVHLSTDYVFDGRLDRPYREDDATGPSGVYGQSKLEGENAVAAANANHVILRTAWIYSPFGKNFVKTMLHLATTRDSISVVEDQIGNPTNALDLADGILAVATNLLREPDAPSLRGIFHMTGAGETNWAAFAKSIFTASTENCGPSAQVNPIATTDYPTPARRPANSRLDNERLAGRHGVRLPHWQQSLPAVVERLVNESYNKATTP